MSKAFRFHATGGRMPKGVLLVGPPGTAKSAVASGVLSRIVAEGRVLVEFVVEIFVVVTAKRSSGTHQGVFVLLVADGGAAHRATVEYAALLDADRAEGRESAEEPGPLMGLSAPAGPIAAAPAYKQAEQALSVARRRGRCLVEHEELAAGSVLPLLADDAVRAFADGLLRALREHDATGRGDLVASLRAWLSRHGQWDAAAADLGVHRHTLRYRMRRVEEILGRSLDDPDVRMELWLSLKATSAAGE